LINTNTNKWEHAPKAVVHPKFEQLQRRDESKFGLLGHVQIVNEGDLRNVEERID
jgi:hypothetical protein